MTKVKHARSQRAFTLLEILVALAILSIALVAMITTVIQKQRDMRYLTDRTVAHWVADTVFTEFTLSLHPKPTEQPEQHGTKRAWQKTWYWQAHWQRSHNPHIWRLSLSVRAKDQADPLATLTGYQYEA